MRYVAERQAAILGCAGAAIFTMLAAVGLDQSYDYDESVTVANFVRQASFREAVSTQVVFNNHPAFTALAWAVNALGGTTETWIRLPAVLAGAASVGLLGWASTRRWGAASGIAAMALVGANPLFFGLSRQARGYSIAAFGVLAATLLLPEVTRKDSSPATRLGYAGLVGLALFAHVYAAIAVAAHGAWVLWHRRTAGPTWARVSLLGGLIALVAYAPMLSYMLDQSQRRQGEFDASFPIDAAEAMFGGRLAAALGVITFAICLILVRRWWPGVVGVIALLAVVWILLKPYDLYPRFLVWLVPTGGVLVAAGLSRSPKVVAPPLVGLLLLSIPAVAEVRAVQSPIRSTATWVSETEQDGTRVCFLGFFAESYEAYLDPVAHESGHCDVTLVRRADVDDVTITQFTHVLGLSTDPNICAVALDSAPPSIPRTRSRC